MYIFLWLGLHFDDYVCYNKSQLYMDLLGLYLLFYYVAVILIQPFHIIYRTL